MSNELFVLSEQLKEAVIGSDNSVLCALLADMQECEIFRLPYENVDVKFVNGSATTMLIKNLSLTGPIVDPHNIFTAGVETPAFTAGQVCPTIYCIPPRDQNERISWAGGYCDVAAIVLIIALATSNIEKKTVANKRARLGIGKAGNKQYNQITYLSLPYIRSAGFDQHKSNERRSPLMHLRRGHSRKQHFGRGNTQTKRVWIAPTFVNADDSYVPRKHYMAPTTKNLAGLLTNA